MNALTYTSINQLSYLFFKTVQGNIANSYLNDSFQPFLIDLSESIEKNNEEVSVAKEVFLEELTEGNFKLEDMDSMYSLLLEYVSHFLGESDIVLSEFFNQIIEEAKEIHKNQ